MTQTQDYEDRYWESEDGLTLHYRDYPGNDAKTPIICVPGLTRNARDFAHLGDWLKGDRRIIMVNLRGRGDSDYAKDSATYNVKTYVNDIVTLMDEIKLPKAVFIGTSLGGVVTMIMAASHPEKVAGVVINDIGPEIDQSGLDRISENVGQGRSFDTWAHAARDKAEESGDIHPDYRLNDWIAYAKKLYRMNSSGRIKLDYDMKISEPFERKGGSNVVLWRALETLSNVPTLILRGESSDLFSDATARKMLEKLNKAELVTVPRVGHAPTLEEPTSLDAIAALLQRID
ncbi:MAG: alpha/beta hydrolase [Parasphingorhabdus sp.]|uniref:alpha/beta fold hydrolase n=1 Tax=Parasphingorhabdus sp. TaxID=2709688 RepID=UPI0030037FA4